MDERTKALYDTAYNWFKRGLHDKAIEDYTKVIEIVPDFADAYNERGIVYRHMKEYDKAIEDYNKAVEINPNHVVAYNNLSITYGMMVEPDKAIDAATKAIKADPTFPNAYHSRAIAWMKKNKQKKAIKDFDACLNLASGDGPSYYWRGKAYFDIENHGEAIEDFIDAMKCDISMANRPYGNKPLYIGVAAYFKDIADMAISNLTKAIEGGIKLAKVYYFIGCMYSSKGDKDKAIEDLKTSISMDPDYEDAKELLKKLQ